jgi:hypothetical protein
MESCSLKLPEIPSTEQTPLVQRLLQIILEQQKRIEQLEEEVQRLKGVTVKPKVKPSRLEQGRTSPEEAGESGRTKPGPKRSKTPTLKIHHTEIVKAEEVPAGSIFKGYQDHVVQDLIIQPNNTCYRLEQGQRADGSYVIAKAPGAGHFGPTLVSYILYQYHHPHVTQPLLLEPLLELGVEISAGQLSQVLTHSNDKFHQEKEAVLSAGIEVSRYLQTDDTGARHEGKNGYCTYIGNDLFAWFKSTQSKSRVNFLELLGAERSDYVINAGALEYMQHRGLSKAQLTVLESHGGSFADHAAWEKHLAEVGIKSPRPVTLATEGALMGSLLAHGFPVEMAIVSDDAGQFNVFAHALCWLHAERGINRLIPFNDNHRKAQTWIQRQIWNLYTDLKTYQAAPAETLKQVISQGFDHLGATQTDFETLNQALKRLHHNKAELLVVLEKPWLPLHNNLSERDIREYVKKRKISGSTRSDLGRRCRDTFASLKKTCRKHAISFWEYLKDRVAGKNAILPLPQIIRQAAQAR